MSHRTRRATRKPHLTDRKQLSAAKGREMLRTAWQAAACSAATTVAALAVNSVVHLIRLR